MANTKKCATSPARDQRIYGESWRAILAAQGTAVETALPGTSPVRSRPSSPPKRVHPPRATVVTVQ